MHRLIRTDKAARPALERLTTDALPIHRLPPPLAEFMDQWSCVEGASSAAEIYLYHGTNCYRRWEINRAGNILPGRSGYSFYCSSEAEAFNYARSACLRDIERGTANSLISEPVVLKVRFTARTWMQADFVQPSQGAAGDVLPQVSVAVLGPVPAGAILEVMHCHHERSLAAASRSVRTFADGSLLSGTRRLRGKTGHWRLDAFLLVKLCAAVRRVMVFLRGVRQPELTVEDELRRLSRVHSRP